MQLAARTAHRVSDPRAEYASRAIPATIPDRRERRAILLLVLAPPSALRHARLWLDIHRRLVRLGALPVHRDIDRGSIDPGVLGPTSFSATLQVRVRHQRRSEPELRLRLPVRARDCRGELMLSLCTPGMSYEDGTTENIEASPYAPLRSSSGNSVCSEVCSKTSRSMPSRVVADGSAASPPLDAEEYSHG